MHRRFTKNKTTAGETYQFDLQYAGRPGYKANVNRFEVVIDGESPGIWSQANDTSKPGNYNTGGSHDWQQLGITFLTKSAKTKIELKEVGDDEPYGRGMRIDDLQITSEKLSLAANTARKTFDILPVNDAPVVGAPVDLGEMDEDGCFRITKAATKERIRC